ncbi:hypothetical protein [Pseudomonas moorei]|uniref:hypothetical protein n=1 Tax=Pseudomonas moorei TaxID=395599 RepID=UPI00200F759E|nr:hypothetical protein [Pseudomonas moorei]
MEDSRNRGGEVLALGAGLCLVTYVLTKAFSDMVGVDWPTGGRLLFSIILFVGLMATGIWGQLTDSFFGVRAVSPIALSTLWGGLWPAMTYWGMKPFYFKGMPIENAEVEWWASSYMHWGGMAVIFFGGYTLVYMAWKNR